MGCTPKHRQEQCSPRYVSLYTISHQMKTTHLRWFSACLWVLIVRIVPVTLRPDYQPMSVVPKTPPKKAGKISLSVKRSCRILTTLSWETYSHISTTWRVQTRAFDPARTRRQPEVLLCGKFTKKRVKLISCEPLLMWFSEPENYIFWPHFLEVSVCRICSHSEWFL